MDVQLMATVTALVRNALCVIKALIHNESFLHSRLFPDLDNAFGRISLIEFCLGVTQFGAVIFFFLSGFPNAYAAVLDWFWKRRVCKAILKVTNQKQNLPVLPLTMYVQETDNYSLNARRRLLESVCEIVIGASFFLLGLSNFHIRFENHPKYVMDGISISEGALFIFLASLYKKYYTSYIEKGRCDKLANALKLAPDSICKSSEIVYRTIEEYGFEHHVLETLCVMDPTVKPILLQGRAAFASQKLSLEDCVYNDLRSIQNAMDKLCVQSNNETNEHEGEKLESRSKPSLSMQARQTASARVRRFGEEGSRYCWLNLTYFFLNLIAFFGYAVGCLNFYLPETKYTQSPVHRQLKFYMNDEDSDWWGNLLADAAWTIEPILILYFIWVNNRTMPSRSKSTSPKNRKDSAQKKKSGAKKAVSSSKKNK
mmetsp:Transcript_23240/g.23449  ORF Transcript_23240/g.23449 Transcript_23240/m.23449 type:complete len:427 (+) Transcript_23240:183-1463(+)